MVMKSDYVKPEVKVIVLGDLMQEVIGGGSDTNEYDAKEQKIDFDSEEEEETLPVSKSIWEDEE